MSPIRKLLFVGAGVLALHGVQACASETELNPQPLPPQTGGGENPLPDPADKSNGEATGGGSSGSSGSSGVPTTSPADAGTDGDAGDAGAE